MANPLIPHLQGIGHQITLSLTGTAVRRNLEIPFDESQYLHNTIGMQFRYNRLMLDDGALLFRQRLSFRQPPGIDYEVGSAFLWETWWRPFLELHGLQEQDVITLTYTVAIDAQDDNGDWVYYETLTLNSNLFVDSY
ncbi:hypothetical protein TorRG33x02_212710 [Trema orientale]|uniref:Uncharacterized protein n=1 Tax=Trema orientale TaxID=63057 RepID=A0A2P5EBQ4_TREOI|nr:hypothetical protein TorRG33x02_212710 [Trema orientale]